MQDFKPIDVRFLVNNDEVKADSDKVKADIASVGQTTEQVTANVNKQVSQLSKASGADVKALAEKKLIMKSVSDKYRSLLNEGLQTYKGLDANSRTLTIQLQNNREALTEVGLAQKQLTRNFELGRISASDYTRSQGALSTKEMQLRNEIKMTTTALNRQSGAIRRTKPVWNGLGNSINQMSRELPAFTVSAQTGILALSNNIPIFADEIGRLTYKNKELLASGKKITPVWKLILKGFLSWQTLMSVGITLLTVYGKEIGIFVKNLFKGKTRIDETKASLEALNKAFESSGYKAAVKDITDLNITLSRVKNGYIDSKIFVDEYNKSLGKVTGSVKNFDEAQKQLVKNTKPFLKMMFLRSAAAVASGKTIDGFLKDKQKLLDLQNSLSDKQKIVAEINSGIRKDTYSPGLTLAGPAVSKKSTLIKEIADDKIALEKFEKEVEDNQKKRNAIAKKLTAEADAIGKANKFNLDPKDTKKVINSRQSLLDRLTDLDKEFARKSFTKDKAELQALRDKFAKMRTEIERFNKKNKKNPIDVSGLGTLQKQAETELKFNQDTKHLKKELDTKKKLFEKFETFKAQFGADAAKKEFKDKIGTANSFYDYLKQKLKENAPLFAAINNGTATAGQVARGTLLNNTATTEKERKVQQYNALLASLMTFNDKRILAEEIYLAKKADLTAGGDTKAIAELDRKYQLQLAGFNDFALKMSGFYKRAFGDVNRYGIQTIKKIKAEVKAALDSAKFTEKDGQSFVMIDIPQLDKEGKQIKKNVKYTIEAFNKLQEKYNQLNGIVRKEDPFKSIANDFKALEKAIKSGNNDDISNKVRDLNNSLHDSIAVVNQWGDSLGQIFGQDTAADIKILTDMASGVTDLGTGLAQLATGDIVGGITNTLKGAAKLYTTLTAGAKAFREEQKRFAEELIALNLQLNAVLNEQLRLQESANASVFITDYANAIFQASIALKDAQANYLDVLNGQDLNSFLDSLLVVIDKKKKKFLGITTGFKNIYGSLLEQYPDLIDRNGNFNASLAETLLSLQDIPDATKQGLEALIEYQKEIEANQKAMESAISSIAGSISNDLRNALVDAWDKGTDAFTAFKGSVSKGLKQIVEQMVFNAIFAKSFQELQKAMEASFSKGGDGSIIDDLKSFYDSAPELIQAWQDAMNVATAEASAAGFDISAQSDTQKQGLSGSIRRSLTEETGTILEGLWRGQFDITKQILTVNQDYFDVSKKNLDATMKIMAINSHIEANTAETVLRLDDTITELKQINTNTKQSQGTRDLGGD